MTKQQIKEELIERYNNTGRIGLNKIRSRKEAMSLIETISQLYEDEPEDPIEEETNYSLSDISNKLKQFLIDY